jgi:toxin ParE1/3/4
MKIEWSGPAQRDLVEIHDFIASDSPTQASKFITDLVMSAEKLQEFPRLGRVPPERALKNHRELVFREYRVIYRVADTNVLIARVLHGRRLLRLGWKGWNKS